jgi:Ca-activated chloride channel family protein
VPEGLHLAAPAWLLALLLVPAIGLWQHRVRQRVPAAQRERDYADAELLPHLTGEATTRRVGFWGSLVAWTVPWVLVVVALAGPRWDYAEVQVFAPGANLVVLLDISRSMEVADATPTRLARARQEIEDLLKRAEGVRVGLVAFATVANVVTPVTDDLGSVQRALPALTSDLVRLQGSRPSQAVARARELLASQPGEGTRNVLLVSDGDFQDLELDAEITQLREQGVRLHVLGVGTPEGGPVPGPRGGALPDRTGAPVGSRLNAALLQTLATQTGGVYQVAGYRDDDVRAILRATTAGAKARRLGDERTRVWHEPFWWLIGPAALWLLLEFRRRAPLNRVVGAG